MGALLYFVILALVSLTGRAAAVSSARAFRLKGTVLLEAKKKSAIDAGEKVEPNEKAGHEDTQELPLFLIRRSLTRSIPPYAVPHDKEQMEPEAMSRIKRMNLRIVIPGKEDFQKADVAPSFNYYVKLRESPHTISSPRGLATKAFGVTGVNIKPNTWIEDEVRDRPRRILRVGLLKMENTAKP